MQHTYQKWFFLLAYIAKRVSVNWWTILWVRAKVFNPVCSFRYSVRASLVQYTAIHHKVSQHNQQPVSLSPWMEKQTKMDWNRVFCLMKTCTFWNRLHLFFLQYMKKLLFFSTDILGVIILSYLSFFCVNVCWIYSVWEISQSLESDWLILVEGLILCEALTVSKLLVK